MTETADPVRVALIGFGFVGKTFHAPLIQSVPGLELTLVSSRHPEIVRKSMPQAQVLGEPEDVATHAGVDLVVIASPNETHVPLATAALNAGKHVIVDKPFTITLAEARRLRDLSRAKGRLLSVFQTGVGIVNFSERGRLSRTGGSAKFGISNHTSIASDPRSGTGGVKPAPRERACGTIWVPTWLTRLSSFLGCRIRLAQSW